MLLVVTPSHPILMATPLIVMHLHKPKHTLVWHKYQLLKMFNNYLSCSLVTLNITEKSGRGRYPITYNTCACAICQLFISNFD